MYIYIRTYTLKHNYFLTHTNTHTQVLKKLVKERKSQAKMQARMNLLESARKEDEVRHNADGNPPSLFCGVFC